MGLSSPERKRFISFYFPVRVVAFIARLCRDASQASNTLHHVSHFPARGQRLLTPRAGAEVFTQVVLSYVAVRCFVGAPDPVSARVLAL